MLSAIAAMSKNRVIGKDNTLPWHMPADLKYFRDMTRGKVVVMGYNTYQSLGKALPNRRNIVLTRKDIILEDAEVVDGVEAALDLVSSEKGEVIIIGGEQIYKAFMPHLDRIYLTEIDVLVEGDTFFPETPVEFKEVRCNAHAADEKNPYAYCFKVFERIEETLRMTQTH